MARTMGGAVAPAHLLHTVAFTAHGPKGAASLPSTFDANSWGKQDKGTCWICTFENEDNQSYSMYRMKPMWGKSNKPYQLLGGIGRQRGRGTGGVEGFFSSLNLWKQILEYIAAKDSDGRKDINVEWSWMIYFEWRQLPSENQHQACS